MFRLQAKTSLELIVPDKAIDILLVFYAFSIRKFEVKVRKLILAASR
jgi:hypothetical protein